MYNGRQSGRHSGLVAHGYRTAGNEDRQSNDKNAVCVFDHHAPSSQRRRLIYDSVVLLTSIGPGNDCLYLGERCQRESCNGTNTSSINTAVAVSGLSGLVAIAAGGYHSLALKSDRTVWACGNNSTGQLGNGTNTNINTPVAVSGLSGVVAIAGGFEHSLALRATARSGPGATAITGNWVRVRT